MKQDYEARSQLIGSRIKRLREQRKLTQPELALMIGLKPGGAKTIWWWENRNPNPHSEFLDRLATVFDVSTDYLLGRTNDPRPVSQLALSSSEIHLIFALRDGDLENALNHMQRIIAERPKLPPTE